MNCDCGDFGDIWELLLSGDITALWTALFCSILNWLQGLISGAVEG